MIVAGKRFAIQKLKEKYLTSNNSIISLFKVFLCLIVIQIHFKPIVVNPVVLLFDFLSNLAVPCFMFLSFFLVDDKIYQPKSVAVKNRIWRLYIPVIFWNIFYFFVFSLLGAVSALPYKISFSSFIKSVITGCSENACLPGQLWFLTVQVLLVLTVTLVYRVIGSDKYQDLKILLLLLIVEVIATVGLHKTLLLSLPYEIKTLIGRYIECIPFALAGLLYKRNFYGQNKIKTVCLVVIIIVLSLISKKFIPCADGFDYNGVFLLFASSLMCIVVLSLPDLFRNKCKYIINYAGLCTMGVYATHLLVGRVISDTFPNILSKKYAGILWPGTIWFDLILLITCILLSALLKLVLDKVKFLRGVI